MTTGLSTRAAGAPMGTQAQHGGQQGLAIVPLSVFFLNMQGGEDGDDNGLYGRLKKKTKKNRKSGAQHVDAAAGQKPAEKAQGGGADQANQAHGVGRGERQTTAAESIGTPLIAPGGPSKTGATHATMGATGSGNVAQYPIPVGVALRRVSPVGGRRRRRRRRSKEERAQWIGRLLA